MSTPTRRSNRIKAHQERRNQEDHSARAQNSSRSQKKASKKVEHPRQLLDVAENPSGVREEEETFGNLTRAVDEIVENINSGVFEPVVDAVLEDPKKRHSSSDPTFLDRSIE